VPCPLFQTHPSPPEELLFCFPCFSPPPARTQKLGRCIPFRTFQIIPVTFQNVKIAREGGKGLVYVEGFFFLLFFFLSLPTPADRRRPPASSWPYIFLFPLQRASSQQHTNTIPLSLALQVSTSFFFVFDCFVVFLIFFFLLFCFVIVECLCCVGFQLVHRLTSPPFFTPFLAAGPTPRSPLPTKSSVVSYLGPISPPSFPPFVLCFFFFFLHDPPLAGPAPVFTPPPPPHLGSNSTRANLLLGRQELTPFS